MAENQPAMEPLASMGDELLLDASEDRVIDEAYDRLGGADFDGLVLRAPRSVDVSRHDSVGVILAVGQSAQRAQEVVLGDNCFLVALRLETGEHWVAPAFMDPPEKIPMPADEAEDAEQPQPEPAAGPLRTTGIERIDLVERLGMPFQPGRYAVTALAFDWGSNTEPLRLSKPGAAAREARIAPADANAVVGSQQRGAEPGEDARHRPARGTPRLEAEGAAIAAPARVSAGDAIPVYGTFRVPAIESWLVEPRSAADKTPNPAYAVVPALVLLAKKDSPAPQALLVRVPVLGGGSASAGDTLEGYLSVDLASLLPEALEPGDYAVSLAVANHVGGPQLLTVEP